MDEIINTIKQRYSDYHISTCENYDNDKLKRAFEIFNKMDKLFLVIKLNDTNKDFLKGQVKAHNFIRQLQVENENIETMFKNNLRNKYLKRKNIKPKKPTDESNLKQETIDYYYNLANKEKIKKIKLQFPLKNESVNLDVELSDEEKENIKKTNLELKKFKPEKSFLEEELEPFTATLLSENITGLIYAKARSVFLYENMSIDEILLKIDKYIMNSEFYNLDKYRVDYDADQVLKEVEEFNEILKEKREKKMKELEETGELQKRKDKEERLKKAEIEGLSYFEKDIEKQEWKIFNGTPDELKIIDEFQDIEEEKKDVSSLADDKKSNNESKNLLDVIVEKETEEDEEKKEVVEKNVDIEIVEN